jgi:phage FluMu protein Com
MVKFRCPVCNQKIGVPTEFAGRKVKCPKCEAAVGVPSAEPAAVSAQAAGDRPPSPPEAREGQAALAALAEQSLDQAVEVSVRDTAPADIEQQRRDDPHPDSAIGTAPPIIEPVAEPDADAQALAEAAAAESQPTEPVEMEKVADTSPAAEPTPQPPPEPAPQAVPRAKVSHGQHLHRLKQRAPGYWFLLVCGWVCVVGAGLSLLFGLGGAVVDLVHILGIEDAEMSTLAGAAAMAKLVSLLAAAFFGSLLGALALTTRRTAINTWLLRQHVIGH